MVFRDRKAEFQANCIRSSSSSIILDSDTCKIIKTDSADTSEFKNEGLMCTFLRKVEVMNTEFDDIHRFIQDAINIQSAILEFSETDERLYSMYTSIKRQLFHLGKSITSLENLFKSRKFQGTDTETRIYNTQMVNIKKRLSSCVTYYYHIQEEYRNKCKSQVKRQAIIAGADVSKLNFDDIIGAKTDIFLRTILPDVDIAEHYYNEIKKRHDSFLKLEKSIEELRDLFFDFALTIQIDYALIDRIDKHTNEVNRLLKDTKAAAISYRLSRKTHRFKTYMTLACLAFGISLIIMLVVALVK